MSWRWWLHFGASTDVSTVNHFRAKKRISCMVRRMCQRHDLWPLWGGRTILLCDASLPTVHFRADCTQLEFNTPFVNGTSIWSARTINIGKLIYQNDYLSCALAGYPCLSLPAEKPLITVGYPAEACCVHFPYNPTHEVTKAWKDEEMCTLQQKKKPPWAVALTG